ncbi:MAG: L,D-transpeptidase [Kaistella sp.]
MILGISLAFLTQCKKDQQLLGNENHPEILKSDSLAAAKADSVKQAEAEQAKVTYRAFIFPKGKKDSAMSAFKKEFSAEEQYTILALNRLDSKNKWRADTLAIPDKIDHTLMSYSPFPKQVESLTNVKKMVFFSYPIQAYALYEQGKLIKWGPTSMGKKSAETKRGLMFANWKKELAISTVDSDWKLPFNVNVHNTLGIGWHQYDLPGFPASHSCLRLLMNDAKFLYNWVDTWVLNKGGATLKANGTPVIVFGDYNWGGKKPWKNLISDPKSNDISPDELKKLIEPHLEKIMKEQQKREEAVSAAEVKSAA